MNEYQDQESEPVPQPGLVDGERVRQRVLGQVAGRRRRKLRRAVIAAVAAAACLGLVAWTWGERIYQMASGGQVTIGEGYGSVTMSDGKGEEGEPLVVSLEAGRLWFVAGGERTDITDLVDEDTPYVHTYTDGEGVLTAAFREPCAVEVCGPEGELLTGLELTQGENHHTIQL